MIFETSVDFAKTLQGVELPEGVSQLFQLMAKTPIGRKTMEKFMPLYSTQKVSIESYPVSVLEQLRTVLGEGMPVGACFTIDNQVGHIFIDTSSPIGVLSAFLLHEMIHALDKRLWDADLHGVSRGKRDELFLSVEMDAFKGQHTFIDEMKNRYAHYEIFLKSYYPKARMLHERLTEDCIADLYQFNRQPNGQFKKSA